MDTMEKRMWLKQKTDKQLAKKEARLKRRMSKDNYYTNNISLSAAKNSLYRLQLRKKPTEAELIVGDYLFENKISFQFQRGFLKPFHRIVDFYITFRKLKTIIEVDGGYHENTIYKDKVKDERWLYERGMKTIRIKNEEVLDGSFKEKLKLLRHG